MKLFLQPYVKRAVIPVIYITTFLQSADAQKISGQVFQDIYANALDGSEAVCDVSNPGLSNVTVRLFADNGNGTFDGGDNVMITNGSTTTNASGAYTLPTSTTTLSDGIYWLIVYSQTINTGSYNNLYTSANTWMEQTYGSGGSWGRLHHGFHRIAST